MKKQILAASLLVLAASAVVAPSFADTQYNGAAATDSVALSATVPTYVKVDITESSIAMPTINNPDTAGFVTAGFNGTAATNAPSVNLAYSVSGDGFSLVSGSTSQGGSASAATFSGQVQFDFGPTTAAGSHTGNLVVTATTGS